MCGTLPEPPGAMLELSTSGRAQRTKGPLPAADRRYRGNVASELLFGKRAISVLFQVVGLILLPARAVRLSWCLLSRLVERILTPNFRPTLSLLLADWPN